MFLSSFESDLRIVIHYWNQCHENPPKLTNCAELLLWQPCRARKKAFGLRSFSLFSLSAFPIRISELGPVQTGRPPPGRGGGWESESLRVFNTRQESGNGTRELRTGSSICGQYGTRNPRLGPGSPGDRVAVHRDLLSGLLGAIQRVGALCFW